MSNRQNGFFVVLEGCDLAGKSTQVRNLCRKLSDCFGEDRVKDLAFPDYDSFTGHFISDFLHRRVEVVAAPNTELSSAHYPALVFQCVHLCDKIAWAGKIMDWLKEGKIVVTGRWVQSAIIYGQSDGLSKEWTELICSLLPKPDLNILLDVDPTKVQSRLNLRGQTADSFDRNITKQVQIAKYYREYWGSKMRDFSALRWRVVNAELSVDAVSQSIWEQVWPQYTLR